MLTLYYVGATFLQSWRIKKVCHKITEQLAQRASIAFYALSEEQTDGYDALLATSELCANRAVAKVSEILWLHGSQRGCCLRPMQTINIMPWISFPPTASWLPFAHRQSPDELLARLSNNKQHTLYLLLETEILRDYKNGRNTDDEIVWIEDYGKLIAWKIDSNLAVLIETDVEHFTKLLLSTFLQNNFLINDQLPLIRIESVHFEGKPQPFELVSSHLRKSTRTTADLSDENWQKHLADLRSLSVLANQATEFEYNKNRTEGKTGIIKPDLIPSEKKATAEPTAEKANSAPAKESDTTTVAPKVPPIEPAPSASNAPAKDIETPAKGASPIHTDESTKFIQAEASPIPATSVAATGDVAVPATSTATALAAAPATALAAAPATALAAAPATALAAAPATAPVTATAPTSVPAVVPTSVPAVVPISLPAVVPTATHGKMKAKPTAIKKPGGTFTDGRFKTTKVLESPPKAPATSTPAEKSLVEKSNELEKAPAASVAQLERTPLPNVSAIAGGSAGQSASTKAADGAKPTPASSISANKDNSKRPSLRRNKGSLKESKPLNILIYSDTASGRENATAALKDILESDMYTIYPINAQQVEQRHWLENTALLVVCGTVASNIGEILVDYFLCGGKVLSLCSDILHFILPNYRTAEVREHELVQFSYDKWQKVKMMHHIFCYQPSPVKKHFSTDSDDSAVQANVRKSALVCPRSVELKDLHGELHNLDVKVLGIEETWNTPSLLLANNVKSGGKAVFSQVHLETSPNQFEMDELKYAILKQNEKIRMEIFADLLGKHLNVNVKQSGGDGDGDGDGVAAKAKCIYQNAYFLGHHESKFELLEKLKEKFGTDNVLITSKLTMQFCGQDVKPPNANTNVLPILIHSCPEDFSTVQYFQDLKTKYIGRLVIYAPVISSSMNVINELELTNGIVVLPRQQTDGVGRGGNQWLSPIGCAMFSIQLHIPLSSPLGTRLPLLQHIIGAAIVNALRGHDAYKILDIGLKWPNDIYANGINKIGGLVINTTIFASNAIVNIGSGINLNNSKPTLCINDMISLYNRANHKNVPPLQYETFVALIFNEIERLVEQVQAGDFESFYKLYYDLWLHTDQNIKICDNDGNEHNAIVVGIDDYGFLKTRVASSGAIATVQPDGNSFDMLKGLILPKFN